MPCRGAWASSSLVFLTLFSETVRSTERYWGTSAKRRSRPPVERLHSPGLCPSSRATRHAVPARPTLEPPLSQASRELVRGTDRIDRAPCRSELRDQGLAHAPDHWLDPVAPLPVFRLTRAPVRLA